MLFDSSVKALARSTCHARGARRTSQTSENRSLSENPEIRVRESAHFGASTTSRCDRTPAAGTSAQLANSPAPFFSPKDARFDTPARSARRQATILRHVIPTFPRSVDSKTARHPTRPRSAHSQTSTCAIRKRATKKWPAPTGEAGQTRQTLPRSYSVTMTSRSL